MRILAAALLAVLLFNLADYGLTLYHLAHGAQEANPIMLWMLGHPPMFHVYKLVIVPAFLGIVWLSRAGVHPRRLGVYVGVTAAAYTALMGWHVYGLTL